MLQVLTLLSLVSTSSKPTFESVLAKFPARTLPITMKVLDEQKTKLTKAELAVLGLLKDTSPQLASLRGSTKTLRPIARVERRRHTLLLLRCELPTSQETFLLSYGEKGALLGAVTFHLQTGSETNVSTVDQAGVISRLIKITTAVHEEGMPETQVVLSEQRSKLTSTGVLEVMAKAWSTRTGAYVDHRSKEELRVFDKRVFYRAGDKGLFKELQGDGNTMRLQGTEKPWLLTWNDRRSAISAQNPEGQVQVFDRAP